MPFEMIVSLPRILELERLGSNRSSFSDGSGGVTAAETLDRKVSNVTPPFSDLGEWH